MSDPRQLQVAEAAVRLRRQLDEDEDYSFAQYGMDMMELIDILGLYTAEDQSEALHRKEPIPRPP